MSEMVERMARAAAERGNGGNWDDPQYYLEEHKEFHRKNMRAVLMAMREPTYAMLRAWSTGINFCVNDDRRVISWQAMIDEELK